VSKSASTSHSLLEGTRFHDQYDYKTGNHQKACDDGYDGNAASAGREFAADDPMLTLEVTMETDEEDNDADGEEGGAEGFTQLAKMYVWIRGGGSGGDGGVEAEELSDGYADGGEGEGGAEPG